MATPEDLIIRAKFEIDSSALGQAAEDSADRELDEARRVAKQLERIFKNLGGSIGRSMSPGLKELQDILKRTVAGADNLNRSFRTVDRTVDALGGSFGDAFDTDTIESYRDNLKRLTAEIAKLQTGDLSEQEFIEARQAIRALGTAVVSAREGFLAAARASDEFGRNVARDARQASREQIEASRDARARFVVDQQRQASAARDASRQRVATIQATARTIASIERGLSAIFRNTARVFSSAFRAAGQAVTGIATGVGRAFQSATTNIRQAVTNNSSQIKNSYQNAFDQSTNIVRNETNEQRSIINNFAREATQAIGGIGAGTGARFALGGIAAAAGVQALRAGFDRATTIETANRGLEVLLGNAEEAEQLLDAVVETVTGTPFALDQFARGASRLVAFGVEAERIPSLLGAIGDAAALSGADAAQTIDTLIRVTGQATATGKLYGDQLIQLGEAGVPALRILGNAFNKQAGEVQELLTDGTIPAQEALDALFKGIVEGTDGVNGATAAFGGLAKELGDTLAGAVSNFRISFARAGANLFETFTPAIVAGAKAATAAVDLIGSAFNSLAQSIVDSPAFGVIQRVLNGLAGGINELRGQLKPVFDFLADGLVIVGQVVLAFQAFRRIPGALTLVGVALRRIFTPANLLLGAVTVLAAGFQRVVEASPDLRTALGNIGRALVQIGEVVGDVVVRGLAILAQVIDAVLAPVTRSLAVVVAELVLPAFQAFAQFLSDKVLPALVRFKDFVEENIGTVVEAAAKAVGDFIQFVKVAFNIFARDDFIGAGGVSWLEEDGPIVGALFRIRGVFEEFFNFVRVSFQILVRGEADLPNDGWLAANGPVVRGLQNIRKVLEQVAEFFKAAVTVLWRGDEYTTGTGWLSEDGLVIKGLNAIRSAAESTISFIRENFLPVLAALGAGFAVFTISGNPLLGVLTSLVGGAVVALSNEDIRNAIVDNIRQGIQRARDFWDELVDDGVLGRVGVKVLEVSRVIGEKVGAFVTDPRFLAALGGIVAAAGALAGAFVLGLVEGVESNLGDLIRALGRLLNRAFKEAVNLALDDPLLFTLLTGLIGGAVLLRRFRTAARTTGAIVGTEFGRSFTASAGVAGVGTGSRDFFRGLTGGPAAIQRAAERAGEVYGNTFSRSSRRALQLSTRLSGPQPGGEFGAGLGIPRGTDLTKEFGKIQAAGRAASDNLNRLNERNVDFVRTAGEATTAGAQFRLGLSQIRESFSRTGIDSERFRDGLAQLGGGFKGAVKAFGASIGTIAGAAFAISFVSEALLASEATGRERLTAGLGSIAAGAAAGFQLTGTPQGAGIGAVAGLGLGAVNSFFARGEELAQRFKNAVKELANALKDLESPDEVTGAIEDTIRSRIQDSSKDAREALVDLGINYRNFTREIEQGNGVEFIAEQFAELGPQGELFAQALRDGEVTLGRIDDTISGGSGAQFFEGFDVATLQQEIKDAGFSVGDFEKAFSLLGETLKVVDGAFEELDLQSQEEDADRAANGYRDLAERTREAYETQAANAANARAATEAAEAATQAYIDKVRELDQQRIDGLREKVAEAKSALDEAGRAADTAREKLRAFLAGETIQSTLQGQVDEAIVSIGSITEAAGQIADPITSVIGGAEFRGKVTEASQTAAGLLAENNVPPEDAAAFLQPLIDAAAETGGPAADAIIQGINEVIARTTSKEGDDLFTGLFNAEGVIEAAEKALENTELNLEVGLEFSLENRAREQLRGLSADAIERRGGLEGVIADIVPPNFKAEAEAAFKEAGEASSAGYIEGIDDEAMKTKAQEAADAALQSAKTALGIESPSEEFKSLGRFSVDGFIIGMSEQIAANTENLRALGERLVDEVALGISESGEFLDFLDAGADAALAFGDGTGKEQVKSSLLDRGVRIAEQVLLGISESGEHLLFGDAGVAAGFAFGDGTAEARVVASVTDRGVQLAEAALAGIASIETRFAVAGSNAGSAFARGLRNSSSLAASAARAVARAAEQALQEELEISSPSRVFEELGRQTMEGFAAGITDGAQLAADAADAAVTAALDTTVASVGGVSLDVAAATSAGAQGFSGSNIEALGRSIAAASKPNVQIDQTFNESVDSRAVAADVAWRLT